MVVMGETEGVLPEIIKVAETKPNVLDAKGIVIATFSSVAEPRELTDYFKLNGRNFLIFDLNSETSGYHITKDEINEGLFGFLKLMNEENLKQRTDSLIQEISSTTVNKSYNTYRKKPKNETKVSIDDIDNMSAKDKNELMNKLIDKGINNLSEYDKKILHKLSI
jgi:hypothetical protein